MTFDAGAIEARLILNRKQFQSELAAARAEGAKFENEDFEATLGVRNNEAISAIEKVEVFFDQLKTELSDKTEIHLDNAEAIGHLLETEVAFQQLRGLLEQDIVVKPSVNLANLSGLGNLGTQIDNVNVNVKLSGADRGVTGLNQLSGAADKAAHSANNAYGSFGLLTRQIQLWGGLFGSTHMIGSIQLWHIALDGLLEATILVTEATVALTETAFAAAPGLVDIYHHLSAVNDTAKALHQNIPPVTGHFRELAHSFAPLDIQALGGALNLFAQGGGAFARTTREVGIGIDDIIAKLDIWNAEQAHTGFLAQSGAEVLHQLAVILGELFIGINNIAKADPGTVHYLLDLVEIGGRLFEAFTELPTPILKAVISIHSFILWGGLLVTLMSKLVPGFVITRLTSLATGLGLLGASAKDAQAIGKIPLNDLRLGAAGAEAETGLLTRSFNGLMGAMLSPQGLVIAAAALGYYVWWTTQADAATKSFINSIDQSVNSADAGKAIDAITGSVVELNRQITSVASSGSTNKLVDQLLAPVNAIYDVSKQSRQGNALGALADFGKAAYESLINFQTGTNIALAKAGNDIQAYKGEIVKLTGEQHNLLREATSLMDVHTRWTRVVNSGIPALEKEGGALRATTSSAFTFNQALALMGLAGVRANDSFDVMQQKVKNLITGWNDMSISGGILGSGINAIQLQSEMASTQIQTLTGAWDEFMKLVSSSDTTFISFAQSISTLDQSAKGVTSTVTKYNAALGRNVTVTTVQKASIIGLNDASLSLRQNWESSLSAAGQYYDALATQASAAGLGVKGTNLLTQAGKLLIAQLLPVASGSKNATTQLYAFAQIAGYRGPNSLKELTKWLGNTHDAAKRLDGITTQLTTDSANLVQDVQNLATAINQNLNQAMAAALLQANGGQQAFDNFANSVLQSHGDISQMTQSATALALSLIGTLGSTTKAHDEFIAFAQQLGLSRDQANQLWSSINGLDSGTKTAANTIRNNFLTTLAISHKLIGTVGKDTDALAQAILTTGTNSRATANDRNKLIADLEKSGLSAAQAKADVIDFQNHINALRGKTVGVNLATSGSGEIIIKGTGINQRVINTTTGQVRAVGGHTIATGGLLSGGIPGVDSIPIMAMPGELVVPTDVVNSGAVDNLRGTLPGFAAGGIVGKVTGAESGIGNAEALWGQLSATAFAQAAISAAQKSLAASAVGGGGGVSAAGLTGSSGYQAFQSVAARLGWTGPLFQDWVNVEMREAGFSLTATNPSSGAYGMAQFINGPGEYAQYGGNANTYIGQAVAMANYIIQRYGNPAGAWAHEQAFNWYDSGGMVGPGTTILHNGTKRPEYVLPPDITEALLSVIRGGGGIGGGQGAPLVGTYNTNYYGTGDTTQAMHELLFTLRRASLELT